MANTLHIVNGDSTRHIIEATDIPGDLCVWRDVLSEGPSHIEVNSDQYWEVRAKYMSKAFNVSSEEFKEKAILEFKKIEAFTNYQEVVLWFEYDLFCQVNMMTILHWFNQQDKANTKISLICVGIEEGYKGLVALGELKPDKFPELFKRRRIMGKQDLAFASDVYEAWCSADPNDLEAYTMLPSNEFPYLADAIKSHFRRFPSLQTGLTEIEQKTIDLIHAGVDEERSLVGNLLRWQKHYGFGDLQFFNILKRLKPIFKQNTKISLNESTDTDYKAKRPIRAISRDYQLGGALVSAWYWDEQKNELASGGD